MKNSNLKKEAILKDIPIITDETLEFIVELIKTNNVKTILEIGSAIGYSSIMFSSYVDTITTIERNEDLAKEAISNIKKHNLENKIEVIFADALTATITDKYDMIFIDGAKAQYKKFFEKYQDNLNENGIIICDNLNFHNLDITKVSRSTRQLIKKLNDFKNYLKDHQDFDTSFYDNGDGLSVSRRIK